MKYRFRIGRIAGIDIYIDSSWFIIFVLLTWMLASSYFPQQFPQWPRSQYWLIGMLTSLLVFASVLIHELAHSVVAKIQGEEVKNITLFLFGGVAHIAGEPEEPLKEFAMASVGPLASIFIAGAAFIVSFFLMGVSEPLWAVMSYLALVNLVLAVFNLLPGYPMDGGRVLRSIIWKLTGDLRKATRIASTVGQGFSFFFIFIGILQMLRGSLSGLWMIFIGWFLHNAAVRSYQHIQTEARLEGVKARDLMTDIYETVSSDMVVRDLVDEYILKKRERVFLVSDGGILEGIVCLEDVKASPRDKWDDLKVGDIMTSKENLEAVSPDTEGGEILKILAAKDIHQLPVIEDDRILGIVCRSDILKYIQLKSELEKAPRQ